MGNQTAKDKYLYGKPTGLEWILLPPHVSVKSESIGCFQGHNIHRFIYRTDIQKDDGRGPGIICVWFGYNDSGNDNAGIRPFFIKTEDIRGFDSSFVADKRRSFALYITITGQGNGVYTSAYTFDFTRKEALLAIRSEGGRHMKTKTYDYNRQGEVIGTQVANRE